MYTVTDVLVVTTISSISVASASKIPLTHLEEREVSIGVKEVSQSLTFRTSKTN